MTNAKKQSRRLLSLLLTFAMVASLMISGVSAAGSGTVITCQLPPGIPGDAVTITLYRGYDSETPVELNDAGQAVVTEAGIYNYLVEGEGYYSIRKLFNVTEEDLQKGEKTIVANAVAPLGFREDEEFSDGYQPTVRPEKAPDSYVLDSRDGTLTIYPDEVLEKYFSVPEEISSRFVEAGLPAFQPDKAAHEVTSQEEMMTYISTKDTTADPDNIMHVFSAGTTPNYHFDLPLILFSKGEISETSLEDAAADFVADCEANGKVNVWYESQIHPNEPAAGENALFMIDQLLNDPETNALLDNLNIVLVPRINPEGSYLFTRATYDGFDMNRDHMSLKAQELADLHSAFQLFMSEVVLDTHEFTFYGVRDDVMNNADDIETTPATSLNNDPAITEIALDMAGATHQKLKDAGLRPYHYGTTTTNPIGRAYFGLFNSLSFLIETRGIGAGKTNYARRVYSQETAVKSYLTYAAEHADQIRTTVADARQRVIDKGRTYDEDDILAIYQTKSGETRSEYKDDRYQINLKTNELITSIEDGTENLEDTITRGRVRPTAYVIPADLPEIDTILYILDNQGAEYYQLDPGSSATLEQIYCVGHFDDFEGYGGDDEKNIVADLREPATVTFQSGAYVIPMDQVAGNVIAMLMEPDVTNSLGYDGTLFQYGKVTYDEQGNFPIYRYTGDDPRTTLVSNGGENNEPSTPFNPSSPAFTDVPAGSYYEEAVKWAAEQDLITGTTPTTFSPEVTSTRAMAVTILHRMEGTPTAEASSFADVPAGTWFSDAVAWAAASQVVNGTSATTFSPEDDITREQMAAILYRYAQVKGYDVSARADLSAYGDLGEVHDWALEAMQWASATGLLKGTSDTTLSPGASANRAMLATILMRFNTEIAK